jgi:hypothetical protein
MLQLTKERPEQNSQSAPVEQAQTPTPHQERAKRANKAGSANFAIRMHYKGEGRTTELPLTQDMIRQITFEAELRNMRIAELIGELMVAMLKYDLFQAVLEQKKPDKAGFPGRLPNWREYHRASHAGTDGGCGRSSAIRRKISWSAKCKSTISALRPGYPLTRVRTH